ncbi:MAG: major facilitator superfamily protein [Parcubacteria group bacterium Gr01-1014_44]|nr:MAG: major facilitator superfamily protein [Parcubacteria group bacterium Gr01-1014_44]
MSNIFLLGLTSLFADFSSEIIMPLMPFFIKSLGGAGLAIGLISGIGDAVAAILKVLSGRFADKTHKFKKLVFGGYAFSALAKFFFPLASTWPQVLAARSVERIGKGLRDAPRDAIVSESVDHHQRGSGFGLQRAMDSLGAILGSVTVLILFWKFDYDFRAIFFLAALISLLALIPILFVRVPATLTNFKPKRTLNLSKLNFSAPLKKFIGVSTLFYLGNFSFMFLILKAQQSFGHLDFKDSVALTLLLYILFNVFDTVFSQPAGKLSDCIGRKKVILIGYALLTTTFAGFFLAQSFLALLFIFPLYGLFKAFIDASQKSFVSDLSETENRSTALGAFETSTGLALIPGGIIAGLLWNANPNFTFLYGLAVTILALILLQTMIKEVRSKN